MLDYTADTGETPEPKAQYIVYGSPGKVTPTFGNGTPMSGVHRQASGFGRSYYAPSTFQTKEVFRFIADYLAQATITYNAPSGGTAGQEDYSWTGSSGLAPYLVAASNGAIESRSNAAFASGIFFGSAAAAVLALAQELSENFRFGRPKKSASGIDVVKTAAILHRFRAGSAGKGPDT
jgi:hypothetical protein